MLIKEYMLGAGDSGTPGIDNHGWAGCGEEELNNCDEDQWDDSCNCGTDEDMWSVSGDFEGQQHTDAENSQHAGSAALGWHDLVSAAEHVWHWFF